LRDLRLSALLHEIGQFSMPDRIKQSAPWQLRQEDREQYEKYPAIGATLISEIPGTDGIVPLIEAHCENYNGSGFPKRLEENQIPLGARILRIADGYDTFCMYSEENQPEEAAKKYLADKRGKIHDPELFKHAIAYVEDALARRKDQRTTTIAAQELVESHMLAENLYDDDGRFLAAQGTEISRRLAEHLAELLGGRDVLVYEQMPDDSPNT